MVRKNSTITNTMQSAGKKRLNTSRPTPANSPARASPWSWSRNYASVCPAGGAILFSGAQMHSTVPNTSGLTRFSIDFRTVDLADLEGGLGAPKVDTYAMGTSLRDFRRARDASAMPDNVVARYDSGDIPDGAVLVFEPSIASAASAKA